MTRCGGGTAKSGELLPMPPCGDGVVESGQNGTDAFFLSFALRLENQTC